MVTSTSEVAHTPHAAWPGLSAVRADGLVERLECPHKFQLRAGQTPRRADQTAGGEVIVEAGASPILARSFGHVEEQPLFHFYPRITTMSMGWAGISSKVRAVRQNRAWAGIVRLNQGPVLAEPAASAKGVATCQE